MEINIFEGARRIALLIGGSATVATLFELATDTPYVSIQYSISNPTAELVLMKETCPSEAARHYFTTKSRSGESVSVDFCLLPMLFGEEKKSLVPYEIDEKGSIWGAKKYSSDVSEYAKKLERNFRLTASDEATLKQERSRRYRENWLSGLGYLVIGLTLWAGVVWAIGWIVRGFLGIPRGMDRQPE